VLGIFRHVWVGGFPAIHPRTHLVIRFLDDQNNELLGGEGTVQFGEPPAGVTDVEAAAVLAFDVPLPRPGQYRFALSIDGQPAAEVPLSASAAPTSGQH
jgi:hypothetical protein